MCHLLNLLGRQWLPYSLPPWQRETDFRLWYLHNASTCNTRQPNNANSVLYLTPYVIFHAALCPIITTKGSLGCLKCVFELRGGRPRRPMGSSPPIRLERVSIASRGSRPMITGLPVPASPHPAVRAEILTVVRRRGWQW